MNKINSAEVFYDTLVKAGSTNSVISHNTKELKTMKDELKTYMIENDIEKAEAGVYTLSAFETNKSSMNETKLMELLNKKIDEAETEEEAELLAGCIEYKPQVNEELVEKLVYDGVISEKDLAEAVTTVTSIGLRFGKVKQDKSR